MADEEGFEALFAALEEHARKLEVGGLSLEDSVKTYEAGAEIAVKLRSMLEQTELHIRELDARFGGPAWELHDGDSVYDDEPDADE